jgi:hyperosmotically inducible protein
MKYLPLALALSGALLTGCRTNETPEAQVNDIEITADVKSKLASDVGLSTVPNISVNSTNGVVTLSGAVDSAGTKERAETIARGVPKVVRVVDNLQIAPKAQ